MNRDITVIFGLFRSRVGYVGHLWNSLLLLVTSTLFENVAKTRRVGSEYFSCHLDKCFVKMAQMFQEQCSTLWISDLLTMSRHPLVSKVFLFRGLKVKEVTIFGFITRVERTKSAITYYVDDGTGVILCAYDESYAKSHHKEEAVKLLDFYKDPENISQRSNVALTWMLERAIDIYDQDYILREGDSVHIIGVISQCTEELRVITVSFIYPIRDLRSEIIMMELRTDFYKNLQHNTKKVGQIEHGSKISNKYESSTNCDNNTDRDQNNESGSNCSQGIIQNALRCNAVYPCMGEWHEEYFMPRGDCNGVDQFDDQIPD